MVTPSVPLMPENAIKRNPIEERTQSIIKDTRFPNFETVVTAKNKVKYVPMTEEITAKRILCVL